MFFFVLCALFEFFMTSIDEHVNGYKSTCDFPQNQNNEI